MKYLKREWKEPLKKGKTFSDTCTKNTSDGKNEGGEKERPGRQIN